MWNVFREDGVLVASGLPETEASAMAERLERATGKEHWPVEDGQPCTDPGADDPR
jgi:hypothetical protein